MLSAAALAFWVTMAVAWAGNQALGHSVPSHVWAMLAAGLSTSVWAYWRENRK